MERNESANCINWECISRSKTFDTAGSTVIGLKFFFREASSFLKSDVISPAFSSNGNVLSLDGQVRLVSGFDFYNNSKQFRSV